MQSKFYIPRSKELVLVDRFQISSGTFSLSLSQASGLQTLADDCVMAIPSPISNGVFNGGCLIAILVKVN